MDTSHFLFYENVIPSYYLILKYLVRAARCKLLLTISLRPIGLSWCIKIYLYCLTCFLNKIILGEELKIDVSWEEYSKRLIDQCAFNIACMATVEDTNYEYFAQDDFRVRKPDIKIKVSNLLLACRSYIVFLIFVLGLLIFMKFPYS